MSERQRAVVGSLVAFALAALCFGISEVPPAHDGGALFAAVFLALLGVLGLVATARGWQ